MTYTIRDNNGNEIFSMENDTITENENIDTQSKSSGIDPETVATVVSLTAAATLMALPGIASSIEQNKVKRLLSKVLKELTKEEREVLASYETSLEAAKVYISSEICNIIGSSMPTNWKLIGYHNGGNSYFTNPSKIYNKFNNDNKKNSRELIRHTILDKPNFNDTMKLQLYSIAIKCPYDFNYTETSVFNTNKAMTSFNFMNTVTEVTNSVKGKILEKLNSYKEIPKTDCKVVNRGFDYDTYQPLSENDIIISPYIDYEPSKKVVNVIKKIQTVSEKIYKKMKVDESILK